MKNDLLQKFFEYEMNNNLFEIEFNSFKIWEILRAYVYIDLEQIFNNLQPLFPQKDNPKKRKTSFNIIINSIKMFFIKKQDYVFLNNPRRVKQLDGKYYCIYTDLLIEKFKDKKCVTFEDPFWALSPLSDISHFEPVKTSNICYADIIEYIFKIKRCFFKKFSRKQYNELHSILINIKDSIEKEFNCNLDTIFFVAEEKILYMILTKKIYTKILKRINPKAIFEFYDVFPSKIVINKVAKELNIPIIEIQHGIVTKSNPIFLKYPNDNREYDCLPNYVISYGEKLLNTKHMPIKKENIYYFGSLFLDNKKQQYKNVIKDKKNILFISQSNSGKQISQFASLVADLLKNNDEYQIIYKMHPYEIGTNYECLNRKNIVVINNREKDLYYYQSISIAQVGIYSTGLYEGVYFELPTFIIDSNYGSDDIKEILGNEKGIYYIKTPKELVNKLNSNLNKTSGTTFWKKTNVNKLINYINKII